jgi:hypothetical protein
MWTSNAMTARFHIPAFPSPDDIMAFLRRYGFDGAAYAARSPDLLSFSPDAAMRHFAEHGWREARLPTFPQRAADILRLLREEWTAPWMRHVGRMAIGRIIWDASHGADQAARLPALIDLMSGDPHHIPALMIGDSHAAFLTYAPAMMEGGILPAPIICTGGSARGLNNPHSITDYGGLILGRLEALDRLLLHRPVLFKFGQVDIEFLFDMQRIRDGRTRYDPDEAHGFITESVDRYAKFLDLCRSTCLGRIMVMSIFPPTLSDEAVRGGYINAHIAALDAARDAEALKRQLIALEQPDQKARTALARFSNARLEEACARLSLPFLTEFDALLNKEGVADHVMANPHDHHLQLECGRAKDRILTVAQQIRAFAMT